MKREFCVHCTAHRRRTRHMMSMRSKSKERPLHCAAYMRSVSASCLEVTARPSCCYWAHLSSWLPHHHNATGASIFDAIGGILCLEI